MKFHKVDRLTKLKSGTTVYSGESVWSNENGSCVIAMRNTFLYSLRPGDQYLQISVYINEHMCHSIECRKDGVASFVVKEVMDIIIHHGRRGNWRGVKQRVFWLFDALGARTTLLRFQAYKDKQRSKHEV